MVDWKFALLVAALAFTLTLVSRLAKRGRAIRKREDLLARQSANSDGCDQSAG